MGNAPSASYSLTMRVQIANKPGMLGKVTSAIGEAGGDIGAIDLVEAGSQFITRDISCNASDEGHGQRDGRDDGAFDELAAAKDKRPHYFSDCLLLGQDERFAVFAGE